MCIEDPATRKVRPHWSGGESDHVRALASSGARSISHVVGTGIDKDGRRVSGEIEVLAAAREPTALRAMAGIVGVQW